MVAKISKNLKTAKLQNHEAKTAKLQNHEAKTTKSQKIPLTKLAKYATIENAGNILFLWAL